MLLPVQTLAGLGLLVSAAHLTHHRPKSKGLTVMAASFVPLLAISVEFLTAQKTNINESYIGNHNPFANFAGSLNTERMQTHSRVEGQL